MNNPKDIIVVVKQNEESKNYNETELLEELNYWISNLKEFVQKRLYKRALKEIITRKLKEKFKICKKGWEITILSIKTKLKIIKKKIKKYSLGMKDKLKPKVYQINQCKNYLNAIKEEFNELFPNNEISNKKIIDNNFFTEELILCYSQYIYLSALFNKKIGNSIESLNLLILIIKFYKEMNKIIKSTNTLFYVTNCFIMLSQMYIANNDFSSAIEYLNNAIEISMKIIVFNVDDIYNGVLYKINENIIKKNESSLNDLQLKKIFINIIIIFLYKGICYENFGNIKKAGRCYKQCDWMAKKFLKIEEDELFISFIKNLNEKVIECNYIYDFIIKKSNDAEKRILLNNQTMNNNENMKKIIDYSKYYASNVRYRELIKKLDNLKIREIDTVSRFSQKKNIKCPGLNSRAGEDKNLYLSNIRLIQAYLRNDFKSIIIKMDKVKLFDLDYSIRERIQKKIYRLNFEKIMKEKKEMNNELLKKKGIRTFLNKSINNKKDKRSSSIRYTKSNANIRQNKSIPKICCTPNSKSMRDEYPSNLNESQNYNSNDKKNLNKTSLDNNILNKDKEKDKIKVKYAKNKFFTLFKENNLKIKEINTERKMNLFFNRNYLRKRDFIKSIEEKELKFQKLYLLSKSKPNPPLPTTEELAIKRSAYNTFNLLKTLVNVNSINNDEKNSVYEDESKIDNSMCKSLNYKTLENYLEKKRKKKEKNNKDNIIYRNDDEVCKNNKNILDKLNENINIINEIQNRKSQVHLFHKINSQKKQRCSSISPNKTRKKYMLVPNKLIYKKKSK